MTVTFTLLDENLPKDTQQSEACTENHTMFRSPAFREMVEDLTLYIM